MRYLLVFIALIVSSTAVQACEAMRRFNTVAVLNVEGIQSCISDGYDVRANDGLNGEGVLHRVAAMHNDPAVMRALIAAGAEPNQRDNTGLTALHWAANKNPNPQIVDTLISLGANPNLRRADDSNVTTLNMALLNRNPAVVSALLAGGANPLQNSQYDRNALHWAVSMDAQPQVIKTLLEAIGDVEVRDDMMQSTPLHFAAQNGDDPATLALLVELGADIQAKDWRNNSPLHRAIEKSNAIQIAALLALGADPNAAGNGGNTPMHHAGKYARDANTIDLLVDAGGDINARAPDAETPLHHAAEYNDYPDVVQHMLALGANADAMDEDGIKPLWDAARGSEMVEVVMLLLDATSNTTEADRFGRTALQLALAQNKNAEIVTLLNENEGATNPTALHLATGASNHSYDVVASLLDAGADPNALDEDGDTALHKAFEFDADPRVIEALMAAGADVTIKGNNGNTPLHLISSKTEVIQFIQMFVAAGADVNAQNDLGSTLLHRLSFRGSVDAIGPALAAGADANLQNSSGSTALHLALKSEYDRSSAIVDLIPRTDPKIKDEDGNTALHLALAKPVSAPLIIDMLDAGADPNTPNRYGVTPFELVLRRSTFLQLVEPFLAAGVDVAQPGSEGSSALHAAVQTGDHEVIQRLLDLGADINAQDDRGNTPLHSVYDADLAAFLLSAGADVNVANKQSYTPLHSAARYDLALTMVLLEAGADPTAQTDIGLTPLALTLQEEEFADDQIILALLDAGADPIDLPTSWTRMIDLFDIHTDFVAGKPRQSHDFGGAVAYHQGDVLVTNIAGRSSSTDVTRDGVGYLYDVETGQLKTVFENATNPLVTDFGRVATLTGEYALIAAPESDRQRSQVALDRGSVSIFAIDSGAGVGVLESPYPDSSTTFGTSVAAHGNTVAVGAPGNLSMVSDGDTTENRAGFVHIYDLNTKALRQSFNLPGANRALRFGAAVALQGDTLLIGAPEDYRSKNVQGAVFLIDLKTGDLLYSVENPDPGWLRSFGAQVAIDGNRIMVSAQASFDHLEALDTVFVFDLTSGDMLHRFENPDPVMFDYGFGDAIDLHGDIAAIGAPHSIQEGNGPQLGAVFIYELTRGGLVQRIDDPGGDPNIVFGSEIALDDKWLVVAKGHRGLDDAAAPDELPNVATAFGRTNLSVQAGYPPNSYR